VKRKLIPILSLILALNIFAQNKAQNKTFWKEDFSDGSIPKGWVAKAVNDSGVVWICTNQPFPGSSGHDQQAPPIKSKSGGFHMQVAPGVKVDKNYRKWKKNNVWPDSYFETSAIDCSGKNSVVQAFMSVFPTMVLTGKNLT
jgi:hypothetical protein